jgi:hypothetical protein
MGDLNLAAVQKPATGAPKGNKNAKKHGRYAGNARRIDLRTRTDKAVFQTLRAIEEDLADLSAQKPRRHRPAALIHYLRTCATVTPGGCRGHQLADAAQTRTGLDPQAALSANEGETVGGS